jgi:hypothetical protein
MTVKLEQPSQHLRYSHKTQKITLEHHSLISVYEGITLQGLAERSPTCQGSVMVIERVIQLDGRWGVPVISRSRT